MKINDKKILDVCCGSKMFWFDKHREVPSIWTIENWKILYVMAVN